MLKLSLAAAGYNSLFAISGPEALKLIATQSPDLVLLSERLPDMDGKELIRRVRAWSNTPLIVLSAHRRDAQEIAMLDLGADDVLGKPFSVGGLMARIRRALRHRAFLEGEATSFNSGGLVVDTLARTVTRDGLHHQVLEAVWGPPYLAHTQYVRVYIGRLRKKIEIKSANPRFIVTIKGVGYRFAAENI